MSRCQDEACKHTHGASSGNRSRGGGQGVNLYSGLDNLARLAQAENQDTSAKEQRKASVMALTSRISIGLIVVSVVFTYYVFLSSVLSPALYPDSYESLDSFARLENLKDEGG